MVFSPKPKRRRLRTLVRRRSCTSRPTYFTEAEKLLSGVKAKSFASRDEQEVSGYADAMDMVSESFESITITENHIKQLHGVLLKYSSKDQEHLPSCSGFSSGSNINRTCDRGLESTNFWFVMIQDHGDLRLFTSAPPRCLDGSEVDPLHRHHRLEGTPSLGATSR